MFPCFVVAYCCSLINQCRQLESQKSQVEIELNEGLRRRNAEVQKSLDSLDEPDSARSSSTTSLATRKKELQSLDQAIRTLDKQKAGQCFIAFLPSVRCS